MRSVIIAVALTLALPTAALARSAPARRGIVAPTEGSLKNAILASEHNYSKVPKNQLGSKKFKSFLAESSNYTRLNLAPGLVGGAHTAYVAKKIYPGRVFVRTGALVPRQQQELSGSWKKGYTPKF